MRVRALATVSSVAVLLVSCGGTDLDDPAVNDPTVKADPAPPPAAPSSDPVTPTGPSIRVTDGQAVVAIDPATGGRRAAWEDAAISLDGNWTVARDGGARASWFDAYGVRDRTGDVPSGLHPTITSVDGRWAVFAEPAPPSLAGETGSDQIAPGRTTSRFVVTDGAGTSQELTLEGNFAPEAFGWFDATSGPAKPMSLQLIEYLPPEHPTRYRVRTLDLPTGALGLPVSLRSKATLVDESMAGISRTQVYAASSSLLFTLYQPAAPAPGTPEYDVWEYGFVHTLATEWAGVWCIDLPEELGMTGNAGALALSRDEQTLYVVTGAGKLGIIKTADLEGLEVSRTADLGATTSEQPVIVAGPDHVWIGMGRELLMVDPSTLAVEGRTELPAPVTALTLDPATGELLAADDGQLRRWTVDTAGTVTQTGELPLPDGLGEVARIAT
jgi:hypothetical protein